MASCARCREVTWLSRAIAGVASMAEAISAADRSLSLVIQFLHWIGKANTTWLLRIADLASCDCRATESMRWLCYPHRSRDWTDDRFISTNFACWDKHRYRRPNIRVNTIHRSQKGCSLHEARVYAATYLHHYSRRGGRVASYRTQTAPQVRSLAFSAPLCQPLWRRSSLQSSKASNRSASSTARMLP